MSVISARFIVKIFLEKLNYTFILVFISFCCRLWTVMHAWHIGELPHKTNYKYVFIFQSSPQKIIIEIPSSLKYEIQTIHSPEQSYTFYTCFPLSEINSFLTDEQITTMFILPLRINVLNKSRPLASNMEICIPSIHRPHPQLKTNFESDLTS